MALSNKLIIRNLQLGELKSFQNFIKHHYEKKHILANNKSFFEFQHKCKTKSFYNYKVAKLDSKIIGIHGFIPLSHFDRKLLNSEIFLTLVLSRKDLPFALMHMTYESIVKQLKPTFTGSIIVNPKLIPFHKLKKFKIGYMNHHVILSPYIKKFKVAKVSRNFKPKDIIKWDNTNFKIITINSLKKLNTKKLYSHQIPLKSDNYILNRYINHPINNYLVYAVFNNKKKLKIIFVVSKIEILGTNVLRMVDLLGNNEDIPVIKATLYNILKTFNAEYIDFYSTGIPLNVLNKTGFINRKKIKNFIIPNYFEPFVKKNIDLLYAFKTRKKSKVRLFKGDSDQDQPRLKA